MNIQRFTATGFNPNNRCAEVAADDHGAWVLHDDVADMQRDAERYRWLRDDGDGPGNEIAAAVAEGDNEYGGEYVSWLYGDELDAAIDTAMNGANV